MVAEVGIFDAAMDTHCCSSILIEVTMVATFQPQVSLALKHTLLYGLFYSKLDQNLHNEQNAGLKTLKD